MDERAINGAAIEAINDLDLNCEIKEVCKGSGEDEWCIQFSGKYGQFCDNFQNQFKQENSAQVIREKIKAHLIKQVAKIRGNTGRRRKPAVAEALESRDGAGGLLAEPLKMAGEVLGRATGIAGEVISQASAIAETARATLAAADLDRLAPATIEVRSTTREAQPRAPRSSKKSTGRTRIVTSAKAKKTTKRAAQKAGKQAKSAKASVKKTTARTKKAIKKASRKNSRRGK